MTDPFISDMSAKLKAVNEGAVERRVNQSADKDLHAFLKAARSIKRRCEITSPKSCERGTCYYGMTNGKNKGQCIFEAIGMPKPYKWELPRGNKEGTQ